MYLLSRADAAQSECAKSPLSISVVGFFSNPISFLALQDMELDFPKAFSFSSPQ